MRRGRTPRRRTAALTVIILAVSLTVVALAVSTDAAASTSQCPGAPGWVEACDMDLRNAIVLARDNRFDFVLPTGSSEAGPPGPYSDAEVDAAGVTICAGPESSMTTNRGPVYVTDDPGHCERRSEAVLIDGGEDPALEITESGVTVKWMTLRARASSGDVAAVDVLASDATIRGATVEIEGGGCSVDEIPTGSCEASPKGFGIRFSPAATGGTVTSSTVEAAPVDASSGSVAALDGIRTAATGTVVEVSTVRGFAGSGVHATASDAEIVGTRLLANHRGVRLGPAADGATVELNRFEADGVGVALSGSASDPGPEDLQLTGNTFRPTTGAAVELDGATDGLFVDAGDNDWGVYECSAVPTRIRDVGTGNLVDYLPFALPVGVADCPSGTADVYARFGFDPALVGENGNRLAFDDGTVDVTVELFDARGEPQAFPGTPDGEGPRIVAEPVADLSGCSQTDAARSFPPAAPPDDHVATFTLPAADLICPGESSTGWRLKLASPVDHRVPDAADRIVFSYHNAHARDLFDLAPPLADLLDRDGTNLDATADPVAMRVASPAGPVTHTADQPLGAEIELLDAAGRVATHEDDTTVEIETGGDKLMSATADTGVATFGDPDDAITEVGVYDQLEATAEGLDAVSLPEVTVEPGALDHVTFTTDPDEATAGETVRFEAEARDQYDNVRADTITYSTDDLGSIGQATGEFTATETGTATIKAEASDPDTGDPVTETATITVDPAELEEIAFACDSTPIEAGTTTDCEATPQDEFDNERDDEVAYVVSDGPGTIDATGTFTSDATGVATVEASVGDVTNTTTIQVVPGPLDHVAFAQAPDDTDAVTPVDFVADGFDAEDNARGDEVAYEIAAGPGSIDADTGMFVPDETGTTTIRASVGDETATTTIDVTVGPLADVIITKAPDRTDADTSVTFVAHPVDAKGNARDDQISWEVASGGGSIDPDGTFHPGAAGDVQIRAVAGDRASQATITVTPGALDDVEFTDAPGKVAAGAEATFRAQAVDGEGNVLDREIAFTLLSGPGSIDDNGTFLATTPGEAKIRAATGEVDATTTIEVTTGGAAELAIRPEEVTRTAGDTDPVTFEVTAHDAYGNPVTLDPSADVTWTVDDPDAGTVDGPTFDPSDRAGTSTVVATLDADDIVRDEATVVVEPGPVDRVDVTPASVRLAPGDTTGLSATAFDAYGNERPAALTWSIRDDIATVDADGRLTARSPGETTVVVRHEPTGTATTVPLVVSDEPGQIASIDLQPGSLTLPAGRQHQLRVQVTDADGFVDPDGTARFRVADPSVASITSDGLLTADRVGNTTVRAVRGDHTATANVSVVAGSLARLRVAPAAATLTPGDRVDLTATGADLRFNTVPLDDVTWSLAGDEIGQLTGNGTFVATDPGEGRIVASARGVETTVPVTVTTLTTQPGATTEVEAEGVNGSVGNVTTTTWSAGVARARAGSTIDIATDGGDVDRARVDVDEDTDRLSIQLTSQPGDLPAAPREVDLVDLSQVASNRTDPAMFVDVAATREGVDLDSRQLNEVVGQVELTFRVSEDYFQDRDLDPSDVSLREYSDGHTAGEVPARLLAQDPVDGAYRYAVDLDSFSAFAVLGGTGQAAARMDWTLILMVGFGGLFVAVGVASWMERRE